jgi:hypothetical protein
LERGGETLEERQTIQAELKGQRDRAGEEFPWDENEYARRRAEWSAMLGKVQEVEEQAVRMMQAALD